MRLLPDNSSIVCRAATRLLLMIAFDDCYHIIALDACSSACCHLTAVHHFDPSPRRLGSSALFVTSEGVTTVVDPTAEEEDLAGSLFTVTVVMDASKLRGVKGGGAEAARQAEVSVYKQGGVGVSAQVLRAAVKSARERAESVGEAMAKELLGPKGKR